MNTVTVTLTRHEADFISKQLAFLGRSNLDNGWYLSRQLSEKIAAAIPPLVVKELAPSTCAALKAFGLPATHDGLRQYRELVDANSN